MSKILKGVFVCVVAAGVLFGFMTLMAAISWDESQKPWIVYEIAIPETTSTHVKVGLYHNGEGGLDEDHTFKIQPIPENRTIIYKTKFGHVKWMFVSLKFYNESGSGYVMIHQENYRLEF